ncbi:MAG: hypothetical protein J3K34DRAFT_136321 [Monoraphidium minutum]|nr:MAG: hypothetical protein J3K34DRAFT_136321 [Monoraphidium minutum]
MCNTVGMATADRYAVRGVSSQTVGGRLQSSTQHEQSAHHRASFCRHNAAQPPGCRAHATRPDVQQPTMDARQCRPADDASHPVQPPPPAHSQRQGWSKPIANPIVTPDEPTGITSTLQSSSSARPFQGAGMDAAPLPARAGHRPGGGPGGRTNNATSATPQAATEPGGWWARGPGLMRRHGSAAPPPATC